MSTAAVKRFWTRAIDLGCVITGGPAEIAHCHSGSMVPIIGVKAKGKKLPQHDWLILPLDYRLHRQEYGGLDANVRAWEAKYGTQVSHLIALGKKLNLDLFALAGTKEIA